MEYSTNYSAEFSLSNDEVLRLCHEASCQDITTSELGARLVKINDSILVKFGLPVTKDEAENQHFAYKNADPAIVRVPKVLRYFQSKTPFPCGYLVMEYIPGRTLEKVATVQLPRLSRRIASVVKHLWQLAPPDACPGPLAGGKPQGYAWSDNGASVSFRSVSDMESYVNKCLALKGQRRRRYKIFPEQQTPSLDLQSEKLVFCHNDLATRNIIITNLDEICLLDWAFAGFYPALFEIYSLARRQQEEPDFVQPILDELGHPNPSKESSILILNELYNVLTRFNL